MSRWSGHSIRAERTQRSAYAFAVGARYGVRTIAMSSEANTASKFGGHVGLWIGALFSIQRNPAICGCYHRLVAGPRSKNGEAQAKESPCLL